ncbi:MAG: M20/M25/M40 family metallo-hydrolase [Thalassobaculum sp.]|uniref:M20 family metallopeptidase n=1 Tax=Thalassobaculum sp. TaxID=2022740 RepID=UPI0032EF70C2
MGETSSTPGGCSGRLAQAWDAIAADTTTIVDDLSRLVSLDTSFPPGDGYTAFADLAEAMLAPLGFRFRRVSVPEAHWRAPDGSARGERVNLIAARRSGRPACSLYYHVDTVPSGDGWSMSPFALTRHGDRLYGRGTADMKGTIAATLAALRAIDRFGLELAFDPLLLLCTDEEGGLYPGIRYLAEQGLIEGHLLSFNGGAAPRIWAGCFGSIDMLVRIHGRGAHSGDPVGGINAAEETIPLLNALMRLKAEVETRTSALPPPPHWQGRPLHARLTIAAMHGGHKGSSLPARFEVLVNRRYAPEEPFDAVMAELDATIAQAMAGSRALEVETHLVGHLAPVSDPTGPHWPRWQAAVGQGFGYPPSAFRAWGSSTSSDMGFVQQAGIREILLGGLSRPGSNTHAPDEFTTIADLVALARAVLLYLSRDFGAAGSPERRIATDQGVGQ